MSTRLETILEAFAGLQVLVIGDAMLDSYLKGSSDRLCPEAPVPVVAVSAREDVPGGAANAAVNVRALGGRATLLSVIGDDLEGGLLRQALTAHEVKTDHLVVSPSRKTLAKHRVIAASQILLRFDQGSTEPLAEATEAAVVERMRALYPRCEAVLISDYAYGVLTPRVIATLAALQARSPRVLVVDSKRLAAYREVGVTAVKPNFGQVAGLLGAALCQEARPRADGVAAHAERILELTGARIVAVTLDADGALIIERGRPLYRTYARPRPHSHAAGAGDTYVSALTLALAAGAHTPAAAELASAAADVVVSKDKTAACSVDELRQAVAAGGKEVGDLRALAVLAESYRQQGRRIIFTNGCFDILHRGHITYLSRAKALGDVLIVGVNSDASVRRLKGPARPINSLEDRLHVLAALSCVDHVVPFDEDTPSELIRVVRPDVFVKGGDYTRERLPEAPVVEALGGVVQILPYLQDRSTTGIIERIRIAAEPPTGESEAASEQPGPENGHGAFFLGPGRAHPLR